MLTLQQIQVEAYATACAKGWHAAKPMRTSVIGYTIGDPAPKSPVFVLTEGPHVGAFCGSATEHGVAASCPSMLFGHSTGKTSCVVYSVEHDAVLRSHALMHTELTEAHDALDEGHHALYYAGTKPEGLPAEIADFVIRVCDTTKALDLDFPHAANQHWLTRAAATRAAHEVSQQARLHDAERSAVLWLGQVRRHVDRASEAARIDDWRAYVEHLHVAVIYAASIVAGFGHDLNAAIEAKMAYNKTRPHRHGGKRA